MSQSDRTQTTDNSRHGVPEGYAVRDGALYEIEASRIGQETTDWRTPFLAEHKRYPTAKRDGIKAWLQEQIDYLSSIQRTSFGDGSLSAYKTTMQELERE